MTMDTIIRQSAPIGSVYSVRLGSHVTSQHTSYSDALLAAVPIARRWHEATVTIEDGPLSVRTIATIRDDGTIRSVRSGTSPEWTKYHT